MIPSRSDVKKSPLAILFLTVFIDLLGFGILLPLLPTYARTLGASDFAVGLLFTTFSLAQFAFAPIWGRISDRMGRRPILIATSIGSAIAFTVFGLADSLWLLFVARAFAGACGASISTAQAYIADVTAPEERARGMALLGAGFGLGFTVGPALAGVTAHFLGVRAPFFLAAGLALANSMWTTFALPEPSKHVESRAAGLRSLADAFRIRALAFYLSVFFVVVYAFSHVEATFILWNHDELGFSEFENGLIFTWIGVVLTCVQAFGTRMLVNRLGEVRLIALGTFLMAGSSLLLPLIEHAGWHLVVIAAFMAAGNAFNTPSITSAISRSAPVERQGEMLGVAQSVGALARIAGPAAATFLYGHVGHSWPYLTTAALAFLASCAVIARRAANRGTPTAL
jgi:DHA1 family tetracycline resistance protein-like MFS transporter